MKQNKEFTFVEHSIQNAESKLSVDRIETGTLNHTIQYDKKLKSCVPKKYSGRVYVGWGRNRDEKDEGDDDSKKNGKNGSNGNGHNNGGSGNGNGGNGNGGNGNGGGNGGGGERKLLNSSKKK